MEEVSDKKWWLLLILSFFAGGLGADRFYAGRIGLGVCKLLFGGLTLGIWALIDFIIACCGYQKDAKGRYIREKKEWLILLMKGGNLSHLLLIIKINKLVSV